MEYFLSINGQIIGPMTAQQVFSYNVNTSTQVSTDGYNWQPLYTFPELMEIQHRRAAMPVRDADSKRILCGIMAILLGGLGVQYFILNKAAGGFITILLTLVTCGAWEIITLIQGIMMLCMSDSEFRRKYVDSTSTLPLF